MYILYTLQIYVLASTGRILSHHRRSGNCAGRSIKRGSALGLRRGNLQRWTSLPVYYQVVYFTVHTAYMRAPRSLSPSAFRSPFLFDVSGDRFAFHLFPFLCLVLSSFLFSRDASTGTYRTTLVLLPMLSMTRNSLSAPPRPSPRPLLLIGYWMFSHLCFMQLYLYAHVPHGYVERIVHIVANCVRATAVYGETICEIIFEHC